MVEGDEHIGGGESAAFRPEADLQHIEGPARRVRFGSVDGRIEL